METTIRVQFYIFLTSIYGGLISGLVYDVYRAIRYYYKLGRLGTIIWDLLFWTGISLIFFYIINKNDLGDLRGYIFIGFLLGGLIYFKILSKSLYLLWLKSIRWLIIVIKRALALINLPLVQTRKILAPRINRMKRLKRVPKEAIREIKRYKKIISNKK